MKIGILTQPLHTNYGGILQCWALQHVLQEMGHEAWVVQRIRSSHTFGQYLIWQLKHVVRFVIGRPRPRWMTRKEKAEIRKHTQAFVDRYIRPRTSLIYSTRGLRADYASQRYDAYVVGSDQVWRPIYSPCQPNYFLDFVPAGAPVKRVAYAASFGTDAWEYPEKLARQCRALASRFDAVSVRESGGVRLCREHLGVEAVQVLDPTLLQDRGRYESLVQGEDVPRSEGNFFCYVLDRTPRTAALSASVSSLLGVRPFEVMPRHAGVVTSRVALSERVYPSPLRWLRGFMDADYVLTDSFHGCVFSIIFNRPFVALGNSGRGQARFHSLLSLFGLESRLADGSAGAEAIADLLREPIDWVRVNEIRRSWRQKSMDYLRHALGKEEK